LGDRTVAVYSLEWGLSDKIPIYSGGLGVLNGCLLNSYADLGYPAVGVGLMFHKGFCEQKILGNRQQSCEVNWNPEAQGFELLPQKAEITIYGQRMVFGAWKLAVTSRISKKSVPLILLDANQPENPDWMKEFSNRLYDDRFKLSNNVMLSLGGPAMLQKLGYDIGTHHIQEGHSALLTLQLLKEAGGDGDKVREQCIFTNHTPILAGMPMFLYTDVCKAIDGLVPGDIEKYAGNGCLNTNLLASNLSRFTNGVSRLHRDVLKKMPEFADKNVDYITNGVHWRFISERMQSLLDKNFGLGWRLQPELLATATVSAGELEAVHKADKKDLVDCINEGLKSNMTNKQFSNDMFIMGFAKRFAEYKRAWLPVCNEPSLSQPPGELGIVYAGKAHPNDGIGNGLLAHVINTGINLNHNAHFSFLEDYGMEQGKLMTAGCDLWVIAARPLEEASGTSGMKVGSNGNYNLSTDGGFWPEVDGRNGRRGYTFGGSTEPEEIANFYAKLGIAKGDFSSGKMSEGRWDVLQYFWNNFSAIRMAREYGWVCGFEKERPVRQTLEQKVAVPP